MTAASVVLIGAMDTKAQEYGFVSKRISDAGIPTTLVDVGVLGHPRIACDVSRDDVAAAAGTRIDALADTADRSAAMSTMADGASRIVQRMVADGHVRAVLVLGGSNAGFVMSRVADQVPFSIPKILVSTIVAGDTRPYVGTSDLTMLYPVVDIAGLNSISRPVLAAAADACIGMLCGAPVDREEHGPVVGLTMFGVTTACVTQVTEELERVGDESHVFHANGTGGRTLEALIRAGRFAAVADITTTELADELCGGVCSAGSDRLTAAADAGVPQVISVGAMDMVNFGPLDTVPARYADRLLLPHNPVITLMRTNAEENRELGRTVADRANRSTGFVEVHIPAGGFSQISGEGGPFHDPDADGALIEALTERLDDRIPLHVHDAAINDSAFAAEISTALHRALDPAHDHTKEGAP